MDATVTGIGSVVVAELRAAGYMESTIGQDMMRAAVNAATPAINPPAERLTEDRLQALYSLR